jgi:hypothetical protein
MDKLKILMRQVVRENKFYLKIIDNDKEYSFDKSILEFLGLHLQEYHNILKQFGEIIYVEEYGEGETYFAKKEDADKFGEWLDKNIDSFLVQKKLLEKQDGHNS